MRDKPIYQSKRFVTTLVGLLVMVLVTQLPELEPLEGTIVSYISDAVLALIAGYSVTDIAGEWLRQRGDQVGRS